MDEASVDALIDWGSLRDMMSPPPKGILGHESQQVKIGFNNMAASTKEVASSIRQVAQSIGQCAAKMEQIQENLEHWGVKRIGDALGRLLNLGCFMLWMWFLARSVEWCDGRFAQEGDVHVTISILFLMNLLLLLGCALLYSFEVAYEERQDARKFAEREHQAMLAAAPADHEDQDIITVKDTEEESDSEEENDTSQE